MRMEWIALVLVGVSGISATLAAAEPSQPEPSAANTINLAAAAPSPEAEVTRLRAEVRALRAELQKLTAPHAKTSTHEETETLAIGDVVTVPFNGQAAEILLQSLNCTGSGIGFLVPVRIVDVKGPPENPQFFLKTDSLALESAEHRVTFSLTGQFARESLQPGMYVPLNEISELAIRTREHAK